MTLALYGKSRRRQVGLIAAALLAVLIAAVGALNAITTATATAPHVRYQPMPSCTFWRVDTDYLGFAQTRLVIIENVTIGGQNYAPGWSVGFDTGTGTQAAWGDGESTGILSYTGGGSIGGRALPTSGDGVPATGPNVFFWFGTDVAWQIFDRMGPWPATGFSGRILLYSMGTDGSWEYRSGESLTTLTAPTRPTNCADIHIKKVVAGQGADSNATFTAEVRNSHGPEGDATGLTFSQNSPRTHSFSGHASTDDFWLEEYGVADGYQRRGVWVGTGDVACPAADDHRWSLTGPHRATINDLGNTERTVCFLNVKVGPRTCPALGLELVDKFNWQTGGYVWESDPGGRQVTIGTGSTVTGGTWTSTVPIGAVIVKAATDHKVFPNPPATYPANTFSGSFDNQGMVNPGRQTPDISNVQFCSGTLETVPPSVSKVANEPEYENGFARWIIRANNAANNFPIEVQVNDAGVTNDGTVIGGTCSDVDISDGQMTCTVNAQSTLAIPVKKAVAQQCHAGTATNTATIKWRNVGTQTWSQDLTAVGDNITVPGAEGRCHLPRITKVATTLQSPNYQTTNPADVTWRVTVTNPSTADNGITRTVWIRDANVTLVGSPAVTGGIVGCTGIFASELVDADGVRCDMPAGTTLTFTVKPFPAPVRACENRTFNNTAELRVGAATAPPISAIGPTLTLLGNPALCFPPTITKVASPNTTGNQTSDPNAVTWTVRVTNPSTADGGTERRVWIRDENVSLVGYTAATGGTVGCMGDFATGLVDADGVECVMPAGTTLTFTVRPAPMPERICTNQQFNNTAELRIGLSTATPIMATGPTITLLGDEALCRPPIIIKNAGPYITGYNQTTVPGNVGWVVGVANMGPVHGTERTVWIRDANVRLVGSPSFAGGANCTIPSNSSFEAQLTGTNGVQCTLPVHGSIVFTVQPSPAPVSACEPRTFNNTAELRVGAADATPITATGPTLTLLGDLAFCRLPDINKVAGPNITNNQTSDPNAVAWTVTVTNPNSIHGTTRDVRIRDANVTLAAGPTFTGNASCTGDFAAQLVGGAPGVPCTMPADSSITFTVKPSPTPVRTCEPQTFNNTAELRIGDMMMPLTATGPTLTLLGDEALCTKTITIGKLFWGDPVITDKDYPTFTLVPPPTDWTFAANCTGPVFVGPLYGAVFATWTCTVPYLWDGYVTEKPAAGWETCPAVGQTNGEGATFWFHNCKQGEIIVKKVVTNVENDPTQFNVTLSDGTTSQTSQIAEWNGSAPVNATFSNLPLDRSYTVEEEPQNGYQVLGWAFAGEGGVCPAQPTYTGATTSTIGPLDAGQIVTVCFYNERFGNVVVDKQAPTGAVVPGTPFNWVISVDVANGPTSSLLTLTDTLPAGFTYGTPTATSPLNCTLSAGVLTCTLPQNTLPGTYTVTIPATAPTGTFDICGEHTNTVSFSGAGTGPNGAPFTQQNPGTDDAIMRVGCVATAGHILVSKVVRGLPADDTFFEANLEGPGITGPDPAQTTFSQQTPGIFPGLVAGTFTVSEAPHPAFIYAGFAVGTIIGGAVQTVQCPPNPTSSAVDASVTLTNLSPHAAICFYNDPIVTIRVHKVLDSVGFQSPGEGWTFTLHGCGIGPISATTNAAGIVTFANLPPAIGCSYTVTETTQAGWVPQFISQTTQPTQPGQVVTLTFLNIRTFDPPCVLPDDPRCPPPQGTPTPTPTPVTPTPTPTPVTPTPTPIVPTPTPTPVEEVEGVVTPGPGVTPTPIAPEVGSGFGQGEGGMSLLLVLAGLISLSLGLGFLALGRRTSR